VGLIKQVDWQGWVIEKMEAAFLLDEMVTDVATC